MSVDVSQPPPLKRLREYTPLSTASSVRGSKCGELFVSKNADKWTFCCSHCQKVTNDIGVFICHIRLDHLNGLPTIEQEQQPPPATPLLQTPSVMLPAAQVSETPFSQENINLPSSLVIQSVKTCSAQSEIFNEEEIISETNRPSIKSENISEVSNVIDISSMSNDNTDTFAANQDQTSPTTAAATNDQFFSIRSLEENTSDDQKVVQFVYTSDEITMLDEDDEQDDDIEDESNHENEIKHDSETETEHKMNDDNDPEYHDRSVDVASGSKKKVPARDLYNHKCTLCQQLFKTKQGVHFHSIKVHSLELHNKWRYKCDECTRGFKTLQGLKYHKITHDSKNRFKCPVCPSTPFKLNIFINHVLTHESDTCFPCQVCGQIFTNNSKRMKHWNTHAKDHPFPCNICYRRYRKQQYLTHHLKSHNHYQCNFCLLEFSTNETQKPPYACQTCEESPDIKEKVKHQRLLMDKRHTFDSDED